MALLTRHAAARILVPALLAWFAAPAFAAYKCETYGKVSYSDKPCPGGKLVNADIAPAGLSNDNVQRAAQQAAHDKRELQRLEKERHKREAAEEKEQRKVANAQEKKRKKCASLAMRKKWAEQDAAAAGGKSAEKSKRKAARKAEQYAAECGA
jgi:hypothetical protein